MSDDGARCGDRGGEAISRGEDVGRVWLDVPFSQKDDAKAAGARWDPNARRWFAPREGMAALERWAALPDVPDLLPGEDRTLGQGLFVDLVPSSCWFTNVRSCVDERDWERLRRMITRRTGMRCEICGATEDREARRWLEAHERWTYDEVTGVQSLRRLICLCSDCHRVTHYGYAQVSGHEAEAFAHLVTVTGASPVAAREHVDAAFALWARRSSRTWDLDLSILTDAGVAVRRPPDATGRPDVAARTLAAEAHGRQPATAPLLPEPPAPPPAAVSPPAPGFWRRVLRRGR